MGFWGEIWDLVRWPLKATVVMVLHIGLAFVAMLAVWAAHKGYEYLWGTDGPTFFGFIPVIWLFDAMTLSVVGLLVVYATIEAFFALKRK
jgi:hypothetical protein